MTTQYTTLSRLAVVTLLAGACAPAAPPAAPAPSGAAALATAERTITAAAVHERIAFLASDELRGRDTPSPGLERAAEYLIAELEALGVQPAGDGGTFVQRFPFREVSLNPANVRLVAESPIAPPALVFARDFFAVPAARDSVVGTPVFLGPIDRVLEGFPADVADRIAIVSIPPQLGGELLTAAHQAAAAGARGLVLALHPLHTAEVIEQITAQLAGMPLQVPIPTFGVRFDHAQALVRAVGLDAAMLTDTAHARAVVLSGATLAMHAPLERVEHQVPNVVGVLPGSHPQLSDEYVVLTAHFDHVGVGRPDATGDSIYNGADDNASGTSLVVEVAKALSQLPVTPARSVVFLLVSGEEKGLLGSRYYAENPTVPIEHIVANINLDMVGRNHPNELLAIGEELTTLGDVTRRILEQHPELQLRLIPDPDPSEMLFFRSDHVSFVRQDVPAIFFTTYLHEDYHRPSDTVEKIDTDKAARIARMVFRLTHAIADTPERPQWHEGRLDEVRQILRGAPF